jgi:surface polysaccharide O-acyltransferase-like enzyme
MDREATQWRVADIKIEFSRLEILRFPLIILVIYIHAASTSINIGATNVGLPSLPSPYMEVQYIITKIARLAVPLFFLSSGFLFFRQGEMTFQIFKTKALSRVRTLLVPYLLWNTVLLFIIFLAQQTPPLATFFNSANISIRDLNNFERFDAIVGITRFPIAYQFWFIRDLIILVALSPLVYVAIKIGGPLVPGCLCFLWVTRYWPFALPDVEAVFFFTFGSFCGIKRISVFSLDHWGALICLSYAFLLVGSLMFSTGIIGQFMHAAVVLWGVASALFISISLISHARIKAILSHLALASFFVFAVHEPLLTTFKKVAFRYTEMRGGSVCLNSLRHFYKWILPLVMPQPGLAAEH